MSLNHFEWARVKVLIIVYLSTTEPGISDRTASSWEQRTRMDGVGRPFALAKSRDRARSASAVCRYDVDLQSISRGQSTSP